VSLCASATRAEDDLIRALHDAGRIAVSAATEAGDWDLFVMRADGSERIRLTDTRDFNETGVRFSPDGRRVLYHRQPVSEPVDNNTYGTYELVIAESDGANPRSLGNDCPWASWGPDSRTIATLRPSGIQIVDVATRKVIRTLPRKGIVQQLVWSPDGTMFCGTANGLGAYWNIGGLDATSGEIHAVGETERYNCTPDWMPDSRHILYARGIIPNVGGRAEMWSATPDGRERRMLYAEAGRHIYGACASPDGRFLLFTRSEVDLGRVDHVKTTMSIIRLADTPLRGTANVTNRLDLGPGWEPHWGPTR
jgi:Tol biopolymer transport system component